MDMTRQIRCLCAVVLLGIISCCVGIRGAGGDGKSARVWSPFGGGDPNELMWGHVYRGLSLSICPMQARSAMGDEIKVAVFLKNLRTEEFSMRYTRSRLYHIEMFDSEGRPVERTEHWRISEASTKSVPGHFSLQFIKVPPGKVGPRRGGYDVMEVSDKFKIEKTGTYTLIVMQPIASEGFRASWKDGFLISNAAKINIVAK